MQARKIPGLLLLELHSQIPDYPCVSTHGSSMSNGETVLVVRDMNIEVLHSGVNSLGAFKPSCL